MATTYVIILDPHTSEPQAFVDVEARDATDGSIVDLQQTNEYGVAEFDGLTAPVSFHARAGGIPPLYQVELPSSGSGPFGYDYLIDTNWATVVAAGDGTEGQSFTTFHGYTFKVYSTIKAAVDNANSSRQTLGQSSSFFIAGGDYTVSVTIEIDPPTSGSYHFYGSGSDSVTITGTMSSGNLFHIAAIVLDSLVEFHHLEMVTSNAVTLIAADTSDRVTIDNCFLRPLNTSAKAIAPGHTAGAGWSISNTSIEGTGIGIKDGTALFYMRITNSYIAVATGIEIGNQGLLECENVQFACSTQDVSFTTTASGGEGVLFNNCQFEKGMRFSGSVCWIFNFVVTGCFFLLGSGEVGINYSGATALNSLLDAKAHSIVGNTFFGVSSSIGIRGGSATAGGPRYCTVVGNTFYSFTGGNEIVDMLKTGNVVAHNTSDSGYLLPDQDPHHGGSGVPGPPGQEGEPGADGPPGELGPPGATGATGAAGAAGAMGSQGPPGFDGTDGEDGAEGPPGPTGTAGAAGATGATGTTGSQGPPGMDGEPGGEGPAGPPGPAGATGATGATGPAGSGGSGGGAPGIDGDEGPEGPMGPPGTPGKKYSQAKQWSFTIQ